MNLTTTPEVQTSPKDEMEFTTMNETVVWELNEKERTLYCGLMIFFVIIMLVGIIGNVLVLIIYKTKFKRSSARVYILSLALADLSVCVIGLPYHILDLTYILTYKYVNTCKVLSFFIGACTISSIFILLVVGLDRYLKVCRPLKKQIIDFGDRKACLIAVCIAIIVSIPNGLLYGHSTVATRLENITGVECFIDDDFQDSELAIGYLGFNFLLFIGSVVYLAIIYGFICRKIYKTDQMSGEITLSTGRRICCCRIQDRDDEPDGDDVDEISDKNVEVQLVNVKIDDVNTENDDVNKACVPMSTGKATGPIAKPRKSRDTGATMIRHRIPGSKAQEKNTRKITLMMLTITVVFIISYLPFIVISIVDTLDESLWSSASDTWLLIYDFLLRIYIINNVANPIIYGFWDSRFRKEVLNLFKKIMCIGTGLETTSVVKTVNTTSSTSSKCCTENTYK
ncbi:hypothetical protein ACF0H5_022630 [Mactra antiquata]